MDVTTTLESILETLRSRSDCLVLPPCGIPMTRAGTSLPSEVERFYSLCGGCKLGVFEDDFFSWRIVEPQEFVTAIPVVIGLSYESERPFWEQHWAQCFYRFAENQAGDERVVVSCSGKHSGLYFDGHQESFGCDNMPLISRTLPELVVALADATMGHLPRPPHPSQQILLHQLGLDNEKLI